MKNDSDAIVTTSGKGTRGALAPGEEPLSLVIRSRDPSIPLTQRQISVVHQIYDDIIHHVKEYDLVSFVCRPRLLREFSSFVFGCLVFSRSIRKPFELDSLGIHP